MPARRQSEDSGPEPRRGGFLGWRFFLVCAVVLAVYGGLGYRLVQLHVVRAPELLQWAEDRRTEVRRIEARRGEIVDANGNALATTRPVYTIGVDPETARSEGFQVRSIRSLASVLGVDAGELRSLFEPARREAVGRRVRWRKIAESVDERTYRAVMDLGIPGVYGNRHFERYYPGNGRAPHVIGFVNKDDQAVGGLEQAFDFYLTGQDGWTESERDGRRREMARFRSQDIEPVDGQNLELTLDLYVQSLAERELQRLAAESPMKGGVIIISEPDSGYIRALASYPSFDPNRFWEHELDHHRNRAISDVFEPGSVFKIVPVGAALDRGLVEADTLFDCGASVVEHRGRRIRLPSDHKPMGVIPVADIVAQSSNRGVAQIGILLGEDELHQAVRNFGFGEETQLPLPGEVSGLVHPPKDWDGLTISRLPMGHAVAVTPLQAHQAMASVANGGVRMQPQLVRRIFGHDGRTLRRFDPEAAGRSLGSEAAAMLARLLEATASEHGTAARAYIPGYRVAGKTGTTQKIVDGRYSHQKHVASFSGFFPAPDPRFVITIVVDEPEVAGVGYGGTVAAPAFRRLAESLIRYYAIPATREVSTWPMEIANESPGR